jgi:hypothetical protein
VRDTTAPTVTVPADIADSAASASGKAETFTATASDTVDGPITPTCAPASGSTFPVGTTTVTCTATDAHGNVGSASFHVTISVNDTTPPQITVPADVTAEATGPTGAPVSYSASATDDVAVATFSCTPASGSTFPLGTTTVNCTATDTSGNTASASFHVTVHDTTAPHIGVPADITAEATSPSGAAVSYSVTFADAVGVTSSSCTPASGSTFPLGTTTVDCTAADAAGNSATGSFHVTVLDTTPPAIGNVPADQTVPATSAAGAAVTYASPTATDLVDGSLPVTCTPASGSTFPVGTTTVQCAAADTRGNTARASFRVTVTSASNDHRPPRLTVPHDLKLEATGPDGAVATYTVTATDPDNPTATVTIVCTPPSGSIFPLGKTTVTCTATDAAGNSSTKTFHVVVRDTTPPDLAGVPDDVTVTAPGPGGAVVSWPAPTATDLVDGAVPVTCTPASGSTFRKGKTKVTCAATDTNGNRAKASFDVSVVGLDDRLNSLHDAVDRAPELHGPVGDRVRDRLKHDLDQVGSLDHGGSGRRACQSLVQFAADLQAATAPNGPVTPVAAAAWIAQATDLASAAGC